jgi:hypothetical protein
LYTLTPGVECPFSLFNLLLVNVIPGSQHGQYNCEILSSNH